MKNIPIISVLFFLKSGIDRYVLGKPRNTFISFCKNIANVIAYVVSCQDKNEVFIANNKMSKEDFNCIWAKY